MVETAEDPELVLTVPTDGVTVDRHTDHDRYRPAGASGALPAVIVVPGPIPADETRPRDWPCYQAYGRLAAQRGLVGVVVSQPYYSLSGWPAAANGLAGIVESVRALDEVDADRIAVWAFSAGGLLTGGWLTESPEWLRCLALSYPVLAHPLPPRPEPAARVNLADKLRPGRPIVLTRVGQERPDRLAAVDAFVARAATLDTPLRVVDVPDGRHGFDVRDDTDASRDAITSALAALTTHLTPTP